MVTFKTYKVVWSWEKVMYRFQDLKLPFPTPLRAIGLYFGLLVAVGIPATEVLHLPGGGPVWWGLVPGVTAYWLTNSRLDGRPPLQWTQAMITWALMPKRWADGHPLKKQRRRLRFRATCKMRAVKVKP